MYLRHALPIVSAKQRPGKSLVDALVEFSGGNALFLAEIVESLRKTAAITVRCRGEYDTWNLPDLTHRRIELPESLRDLIAGRIAELNRDLLQTLKIASVLGRDFSLEALVYLLQRDENSVRSHLDDFIHLHRLVDELEEKGKGRRRSVPFIMFRFRSRAIQVYVHDRLGGADQRRWHKKAGEYLENLPSEDRKEWVSQLATHFFIAQEWTKAFHYALEAARSEYPFYCNDNVQYLEQALSLLERVPTEEHMRSTLEKELKIKTSWEYQRQMTAVYGRKLFNSRCTYSWNADLVNLL